MNDAFFSIRDDRALIRVAGEDTRPFLQGLVSNDIDKVGAERAIYAAFLTAQGKFLHEFFIAEFDGALLLDCEAARRDDLLRRLTMYNLRSKATIELADDLSVTVVFGDGALPALGLEPAVGAANTSNGGVAFVDPRLVAIGARTFLPRDSAATSLTAAGYLEGSADAYETLRLSLGLPDGSRDLEIEKSILLESGFDELNGVDWDKGCFLGQELTARTKYRGLVKKRLMPVAIDGPAPAPGTALFADGKDAGEMRSAHDKQGIALIRIDALNSGHPLTADKATIHPKKPDWLVFQEE